MPTNRDTESTTRACDFCGATLGEPIYRPIGTRRNMGVFACPRCGLLQSFSLAPFTPERRVALSCDADWGNVRHGKGVRFEALRPMLEALPWDKIHRVLDVGASRGDFVLWVAKEHPGVEIYAVEPDESVMGEYRQHPGIKAFPMPLGHLLLEPSDLIYCVHTLEHETSAAGMLRLCRTPLLRPGGTMLLEVPNVASICQPHNVEEFFLDKHNFHFGPYMLTGMVEALGFEVARRQIGQTNILFELRRAETCPGTCIPAGRASCRIGPYAATLAANRAKLPRRVENVLRPMAQHQRVAYWGAGRVFAALRQYGGLRPEDACCVVDGHLWRHVGEVDGFTIAHPGRLREAKADVLVISALASADSIAQAAREYGIFKVLRFADLMEQEA